MRIIEENRLSPRQVRCIEALLRQPTVRAAARESRVSEPTVFKWLSEPFFNEAYRTARSRLLEGAVTALQGACGEAVTALVEVIQDRKSASAQTRVYAARTILELALRAKGEIEIEERLARLESKLNLKIAS